VIAPRGDRETAGGRRSRVFAPQRRVIEVLGLLPRSVVLLVLGHAGQRRVVLELERAAAREPSPAKVAAFERDKRLVEPVDRRDERGAGHRKVTEIRAISALAVIDALHDLRHHAVDVEVTLAMAVRAKVPRHPIDERREGNRLAQSCIRQRHDPTRLARSVEPNPVGVDLGM